MIALPEFSFWSGLPPGTVPTTPAPLQLALNMDPDRLLSSRESPSPTSNEAGMHMPPLPSPLPGTNVGFDDAFAEAFASYETCSASQLGHSEISHRQIALSSDSPFHCQFPHPESKWLQPARTRQSLTEQSSSPFINAGKSSDLHAGMQRNILAGSRGTNDWSQEHEAVLDSIEHISSLVFPEPPRIKDCQKCRHQIGGKALENPAGSEPLCSCSPEGQIPCNAPPQIHLHKMYGPRDDPLMLPKCRGLYDGTGYGDSISSMISLPSSLSTLEPYHDEVVYNLSGLCKPFTAKNDRTQGNTADDETLEDVILAYATYDEGAGEKQDTNHPDYANSSEDIAAETQADVELADRVAECSLGA